MAGNRTMDRQRRNFSNGLTSGWSGPLESTAVRRQYILQLMFAKVKSPLSWTIFELCAFESDDDSGERGRVSRSAGVIAQRRYFSDRRLDAEAKPSKRGPYKKRAS